MTHSEQDTPKYACHLCQGIDLELNNVENAKVLGVSEATIRRHKAHMGKQTDAFFTTVPISAITSRRSTVRLPDGSYERVTYDPRITAMLESRSYEDLERAIDSFTPTKPLSKEDATGDTFVVCPADLQVGKAKELRGGSEELIERVMTSLAKAQDRAREFKPAEIILADLGDIIEGFSNTGSQPQTNDLDLTTQVRTARRLMLEAIRLLAPLTPRLVYVTVPSNHCQVRAPGSKDLASIPQNDWGCEIAQQLQDALEDRAEFRHVTFEQPEDYEEALTLHTQTGTALGMVHGHQARSPEKIADWWKGQSHGRRSGLHLADILLFGHYHSLRVQQSGDGRWLIGAPTSDNGSGWFANKTGESSTPGMLSFTTRMGEWANLEIL